MIIDNQRHITSFQVLKHVVASIELKKMKIFRPSDARPRHVSQWYLLRRCQCANNGLGWGLLNRRMTTKGQIRLLVRGKNSDGVFGQRIMRGTLRLTDRPASESSKSASSGAGWVNRRTTGIRSFDNDSDQGFLSLSSSDISCTLRVHY